MKSPEHTFGTGSSKVVENCQTCDNPNLDSIMFLGYLPPVNAFRPIGERPKEQPSYPAELLYCSNCHLVQLGLTVDPKVIFPAEYPYTSSTTRILRENFAHLSRELNALFPLSKEDLVVDIGSNDGNLLSNFVGRHRVLGITPEDIGKLAIAKGIPTILNYFTPEVAEQVVKEHGPAKVVTATNVFAHIEDPNAVTESIKRMMTSDGLFVSESHYLYKLLNTVQYDTIYHEHLRHYSLHSLENLLNRHDLEVVHAREIPTHGGSIRVYAARKGQYPVNASVAVVKEMEKKEVTGREGFERFRERVVESKLALYSLLHEVKQNGARIWGISAPSRGSTLLNYTGIKEDIIGAIAETPGSYKIGKYVPGTLIPVVAESEFMKAQPEYALLLSWHIADELAPKIRNNGYKGKFIVPLPEPRII